MADETIATLAGVPAQDTAEPEKDNAAPKLAGTESGETADDSATSEDGDNEKPKKEGGFQKRIRKLATRAELAQQEADFWRERALASQPKAEAKPEASAEKPKPQPKDFDLGDGTYDVTAYNEARDTWLIAKAKAEAKAEALAEIESRSKKEAEKSQSESLTKTWQEKEAKAREKHKDYDEVVEEGLAAFQTNPSPSVPMIARAIMAADDAELAYYFGQNPDEAVKLAKMSPERALMELGRIEARIAQEKPKVETEEAEQPPPPVTKAPKPPTPVTKPSATATNDPEKMSFKEYQKWRDAQTKRK